MAVTFGFYNSQNGDRVYNADQMSSLFAGIIRDGVFEDYPAEGNHLKIRKGTGLNMIVGPGRAWFNNTWTDNDAELTIAIDPPPAISGMDRVDAIVLEINKSNTTDNNADISPYVVEGRTNKFVVLKGTPAPSESATHPTPRNGNGIYQHPLAWVRVSGSSPGEIVSFNNLIGATDQCPFVLNAIENVSAEDVIQSWTDALNAAILQFHNNAQTEIDAVVEDYFNDPGSEVYTEIRDLQMTLEGEITDAVNGVKPLQVWFRLTNGSYEVSQSATYFDIDNAVNSGRPVQFQYAVTNGSTGSGGRRGNKMYVCYRFYRDSWGYPSDQAGLKTYHIDFIDDTYSEIVRVTIERGEQVPGTGGNNPSQPTYGTSITYETIHLKPLEAHFTVENNTASCDKTFAELSAAILAGRDLLLFFDDGSTYIKLAYWYHTANSGTTVDAIGAHYSHITPVTPGTVEDDWAWDCVEFSYTQSHLTYYRNTQ